MLAVLRSLETLGIAGTKLDYEKILEVGYRRFLGPGCYVADVGAHEGDHTQHFVKLVGPTGRVIAFEPIPAMADELRQWFSGWPNAEIHNCALGATVGTTSFTHVTNMPWFSGVKERDLSGLDAKIETIEVAVDTIDNALAALPRLDYIKIDIEGGEMDCLKGAESVLSRHRPVISVEYGSSGYSRYGYVKRSLFDFAVLRGYATSDLFGNIIDTPERWDQICDVVYWDYFLVPKERLDWWRRNFLA